MKLSLKMGMFCLLSLALVFCCKEAAMATTFTELNAGKNITINDTIANSTYSGGSQALNTGGEDNETEIGTYTGQKWDFEGMFWNKSTKTLTLIAGWNFQNGVQHGTG